MNDRNGARAHRVEISRDFPKYGIDFGQNARISVKINYRATVSIQSPILVSNMSFLTKIETEIL